MPHLVLIDGPNYVFRAFHAIRALSNSKGEPTNAVFGYVQMLRSVLKELSPTHAAVAFDPKDGSFRNRIYPAYKAHRPPMPEELAVQWSYVFEVTRGFNLPLIQINDYEADDTIATLARQAEGAGWDVTIVSSDKDLMQLTGERIRMLDTMKHKTFGSKEVKEKWGVTPERVHDLLALAGDASDNIPGVPGIGPKTAAQLINEYGNLEGVLAHATEIRQRKRRENLTRFADEARLSYRLVALDEQAPVGLMLDDLIVRQPDRKRLARLFTRLEFQRLLEEFGEDSEKNDAPPVSKRTDHLVDSGEALTQLLDQLRSAELIAVDTETTSLACHDAEIVGISFAVRPGEAWYIPVGHESPDMLSARPRQLARDKVLNALKSLLEDEKQPKCGHNLKYDMQVFHRAGIRLAGIRYDSMLLAYCLQPGKYPPSMDAVAEDYLGHHCIPYKEVAGKGARRISFAHVPIEKALPYAAEDAEIALRLSLLLKDRLAAEARLARHDEIELPLSFVLADMEWAGAHIDARMLSRLSGRFGARMAVL